MRLRLQPEAADDLEQIHHWIAQDRPAAAIQVVRRILTSIERLEAFPSVGRRGRDPGLREWSVPGLPYLVVYEIDEIAELVIVISVVHAARDQRPGQPHKR